MTEEIGKRDLAWFIAQTKADILAIDDRVTRLQSLAERLRADQTELVKVLKKLEAS